jgi:hypothetical protein
MLYRYPVIRPAVAFLLSQQQSSIGCFPLHLLPDSNTRLLNTVKPAAS